jgi:hypothetical protein
MGPTDLERLSKYSSSRRDGLDDVALLAGAIRTCDPDMRQKAPIIRAAAFELVRLQADFDHPKS